jgi:hypothetical protein
VLARLLLLVALVAAGCSSPAATAALQAVLVSPTDVAVRWTEDDPAAAGRTVEYATTPEGPFTILAFVPAGTATYTHPSLMPRTTFYYRTRPYRGPVSNEVTVLLPPGALPDEDTDTGPDWAAPRKVPRPSASHAPGAAPTGLTGTVHDANGVALAWTDHASDETGYLLEVRPSDRAAFTVVDVLDPDVDAVGFVATAADQKRATYRVRAFRYGPPSTVVSATTGEG